MAAKRTSWHQLSEPEKKKMQSLIDKVKLALEQHYNGKEGHKGTEIAKFFEGFVKTNDYDIDNLKGDLNEKSIDACFLCQRIQEVYPNLGEGLIVVLNKAAGEQPHQDHKVKARSIAENQLFDDYYLGAFNSDQYYDDDNLYAVEDQDQYGIFDDAASYAAGYARSSQVWNGYAAHHPMVYGTDSITVGQVELYYAMEVAAIIFFALTAVFLSCCVCLGGIFLVKRWGVGKNKKREVEFQPVEQEEYV